MITLMKTGPYNPIKEGLTKYESYQLVTLQQHDPSLEIESMKNCVQNITVDLRQFDYITTSGLKRTKDTAQYLITHGLIRPCIKYMPFNCLNEVKFDMRELCSKKEYEQQGSTIVRKRFVSAFVNDTLTETRKHIEQRVKKLEEEIIKLQPYWQHILCVSHTFFIKLYLIYRKHPKFFDKPEIIKHYLDPTKRIMEFCETISFAS